MKKSFAVVALLVGCGLVAQAGGGIKSGPQVGENARPKPFFPLNINGPTPDEKQCLVCRNGNNPVAMIFAREPSEQLTNLISKLDAETIKNSDKKMGSFAVFCNDSEGLAGKLRDLAKTQKLKSFTLAIDNVTGPEPYKIAKDADVTVVLYNKSKVIANYTFKKGELNAKSVDQIVSDVSKIVK
ncbi:MAG TPA: hypothetical protein VFE62_11505 [Gemmataceae bacterium]|nr:hypothetical protein [Gemmataceae bacterium]